MKHVNIIAKDYCCYFVSSLGWVLFIHYSVSQVDESAVNKEWKCNTSSVERKRGRIIANEESIDYVVWSVFE